MIYLYAILVGLTLVIFLLLWLYAKKSKGFLLKLQKYEAGFKSEINDLTNEVRRESIIIDDYKKKLQFNSTSNVSKISSYNNAPNQEIVQNMITDKQQLEKETELFKQKNQKLWEQSLAVYKEKERIDSIRKYIESRHSDLTKSINYAQRIQEALLPSEELLKQLFPKHFILYRPRNIVSGDFYWTKQVNNKTILAIADCTGHGVPGAFMSLLGISFLNEIASTDNILTAAQILEEMRTKVKNAFHQDKNNKTIQDGMDMVVCIINNDTNELQFSGANNGIFIVKNDNSIIEIKGIRNPISEYPKEKPFENHKIKLQANDKVFMYSDGYFDQFGGPKKTKITKKRFVKLLEESQNKKLTLQETKKELEHFIDNWQGEENQVDDILVCGITL
jgi:serine phosphatase RsbU (regulator of sigma subunit)